jgi:hypothetical protein
MEKKVEGGDAPPNKLKFQKKIKNFQGTLNKN